VYDVKFLICLFIFRY